MERQKGLSALSKKRWRMVARRTRPTAPVGKHSDTHQTTTHSRTGTPPCELLMGRSLLTQWDILNPDLELRVSCMATISTETALWQTHLSTNFLYGAVSHGEKLPFWSRLGSRRNYPVTGTTYILSGCGKWSILEAPSKPFEKLCAKAPSSFTDHTEPESKIDINNSPVAESGITNCMWWHQQCLSLPPLLRLP